MKNNEILASFPFNITIDKCLRIQGKLDYYNQNKYEVINIEGFYNIAADYLRTILNSYGVSFRHNVVYDVNGFIVKSIGRMGETWHSIQPENIGKDLLDSIFTKNEDMIFDYFEMHVLHDYLF